MKTMELSEHEKAHWRTRLDEAERRMLDLLGRSRRAYEDAAESFDYPEDAPGQAENEETKQFNLNLGDRERGELDRIREAQRRLARGQFGDCRNCGRAIPAGRLESIPYAEYCRDCQEELGH
jgi:RNA polymerase-binding protein DksA